MPNRRKFTDYEKKTVYARGNGRCALCGRPIDFESMTIDHKIPLSRGGTNDFANLQPTCGVCNLLKNALMGKIAEIKRNNRKMRIRNFLEVM